MTCAAHAPEEGVKRRTRISGCPVGLLQREDGMALFSEGAEGRMALPKILFLIDEPGDMAGA